MYLLKAFSNIRGARMVRWLLLIALVVVHCGNKPAPDAKGPPETKAAAISKKVHQDETRLDPEVYGHLVTVRPVLVVRTGPGVEHKKVGDLPYDHRVKVEERSEEDDRIFDRLDRWCRISTILDGQPIAGWSFCAFLDSWPRNAGWTIENGTAVNLGSEEYIESRGLNECTQITSISLSAFQGGCIGNQCYECDNMRLRPDGQISISASDISGDCYESVGGKWSVQNGTVQVVYMSKLAPTVVDACYPPGALEEFQKHQEKENMSEYGKNQFNVRVTRTYALDADGKARMHNRGVDLDRLEGKKDFGKNFDYDREVECIYPYSPVLRNYPNRFYRLAAE